MNARNIPPAGNSACLRPWRTPRGWVRISVRLVALLTWTLACHFVLISMAILRPVLGETSRRVRWNASRRWARGALRLIGARVVVQGPLPKDPYLLVANHVCWLDAFAITVPLDCTLIGMVELNRFPIARTIFRSREIIFVDRTNRDEVPVINDRIDQTLAQGRSIMFCPEGVISPGKDVRRFRAALLESSARARRPVYYATFTYRTPEGYAPPSEAILYGPDPYVLDEQGSIPEAEIELWGHGVQPALPYVARLLSMPFFEINLTFGEDPITADDRITLANALQAAVRTQFIPVA